MLCTHSEKMSAGRQTHTHTGQFLNVQQGEKREVERVWLEQLKTENEERYSRIQIQKKIDREKKARDRFLSPRADLHTQRGCEHSALRVRSQTKKDTVNINLC